MINYWAWDTEHLPLGWYTVNFTLFVLLVAYAAWPTLRQALQRRQRQWTLRIRQAGESLRAAEQRLSTLQHQQADLPQALAKAHAQAMEMAERQALQWLDQARAQAEVIHKTMQLRIDYNQKRLQKVFLQQLLTALANEAASQIEAQADSAWHEAVNQWSVGQILAALPSTPNSPSVDLHVGP